MTREVGLLEGLATTRAIRRFRPDPVSDEDLAAVFFGATRAPSGSNRQPFRFLVLRDGPRAREARALLGEAFRAAWQVKAAADGYPEDEGTRRGRTAGALRRFVEHFEEVPVVVLACLVRYRAPHPTEAPERGPIVRLLHTHLLDPDGRPRRVRASDRHGF